jgi:peptidoglycan hydrolase-like protein with peptidoglycan-binding domain
MPARIDAPVRPIVPPVPAPVPPAVPARTLREAEKLLKRSGYGVGTIDGKNSPALQKAVREFQAAWKLPVTGTVDNRTLARLRTTGKRAATDTFSVGQKGGGIKDVERRLKTLGYEVGKADGTYSKETAEAVKKFKADQANIKNESGAIGKAGRKILKQEVDRLSHRPERRRLAPTKSQQRLDARTAKAASARHPDGTVGLGEGSKGPSVENVQKHLRAAGFSPKHVNGKFDERTEGALEAFQRKSGLEASGRVDGKTWKALQKSYILSKKPAAPAQAIGERSGAVKASEKLLKKLGLNPGKVDGLFDRNTLRAVKKFEKKHKLETNGKIGTGQLAKMKKAARRSDGIQVTREMRRLAKAGTSVALSMGGYTGLGRCATGVSAAIRKAMGISVWGNGNQIDNNLPRDQFKQVKIPLSKALKIPGLILTWEKTSTSLGSIYGHTAITTGNGYASASDFVERNTLTAGGRSGLKIFVPI